MRLPKFEYASPKSVEAAVKLLAQAGSKARILAGGTDLLPSLKRRSVIAELIVNIKEIDELRRVEDKGGGTAFNKVAKRRTLDFALVNAAARISREADGVTCKEASAVVSGSSVSPEIILIKRPVSGIQPCSLPALSKARRILSGVMGRFLICTPMAS